ncbi:MAG: UDP-N-acetylmuramoyl-L-alanyl-D-glutamate--2,6-diaminopimelate ligase [Tyzzerella sp.]|uniref:UDP-N-acetylmuramoyl-L-alanyl-D-glutamate--2,6-diaminopimelate ligase n=1 Tax=Candidatus Fimicola merdigallinarum TaxID=2840819 RepID=A0A9D9DWE1_9FIRM|nr:UDP-N-acetylmuramoyl-L-alanyl-D-glutamate--2,6-diaminopimelate ligase [Candidatus Fimicola merdigallinarum]
MKVEKILHDIEYKLIQGSVETEFEKIEYDSRKVSKGDAFVCVTGFKTDGHNYVESAIKSGATVIFCERELENIDESVTVIQFENTRKALAHISAEYYGRPSERMNVIGVTGTNGKTTTTFLVKSVLDKIGHKTGIIGTIENRIGDRIIATERTTPESLELQELFKTMADEGCQDVVMEVSSHALDLHRVDDIRFNVGIFTNLTQDHLDYHVTMENYKKAKGLLFERCLASVVNIDDEAGEYMVSVSKGKVITFAIDKNADLKAEDIHISADGVEFKLEYDGKEYPVSLNTPGKFSIYNALGAIGACILMGIDMDTIISGLKENKGVNGRFQTVRSKRGFNAIVDYAHTPDGLENILKTAKEFVKGRIITVFGCGGDRDRTKRPIMGEIAGIYSDYCIITSDNPRTEDPAQILDDVEPGTKKSGCEYTKIVDRGEAIKYAIDMAKEGDVVIVAGKGHENYQIFADKTIHFDDVEEVKKAFGEDVL